MSTDLLRWFTLSSGARLVCERMPGTRSAAAVWMLPVGTAGDPLGDAGEGESTVLSELILRGAGQVHSGFVAIPLALTDRYGLAVLACIITSTPGTIWVSYDPAANVLLIHVLDLVDEATWIGTIQQRYERPLLEIFQ